MKKPIVKLAALDTAIEAERRTIERLQGNLQQMREEARKAEEAQGRLAYKALGEGEAAAQAELTKAEELLSKSQARAKSAEIALKAAQDKLVGLHQERQEAFFAQKRDEYAREAVELLKGDAEELESALILMTAAREGIRDRLRKMEALGIQAGIDTSRTHTRVRENLRHAIECRGQFDSIWLAKEAREAFKQPIPILLQATLKNLIPELEEEERRTA
jgi:hypothetical protein